MKISVSITLDKEVIDEIEKIRNGRAVSVVINEILRKQLGLK